MFLNVLEPLIVSDPVISMLDVVAKVEPVIYVKGRDGPADPDKPCGP